MSYSYVYKTKDERWGHWRNTLESLDTTFIASTSTAVAYLFLLGAGVYYLLRQSNILPPNAIQKFLWRCFVYTIPPSLVLALEKREQSGMDGTENRESFAGSRTYGAKSEAIRKILGLSTGVYSNELGAHGSIWNAGGIKSGAKSRALPGLFNRDNECYQNSVIQGLASLPSFTSFVEGLPTAPSGGVSQSLKESLEGILRHLNDPDEYGKAFWTPWALKSMSSWQQQDAQEYFSKVLDELEKDSVKLMQRETVSGTHPGLGCLRQVSSDDDLQVSQTPVTSGDASRDPSSKICNTLLGTPGQHLNLLRNPLEGLQAQRVGCLNCGFVEGLSFSPFNCITVSLGKVRYTDLESCLSNYTDLENISGVGCARCTLLRQEKMLKTSLTDLQTNEADTNAKTYSDAAEARLQAVRTALRDQDFSESTLAKKCKIPSKSRVTTTKTRQAVIARPPKALAIHINRSVFDENTGVQFKNFAGVQFPKSFDLSPWCLGLKPDLDTDEAEVWELDPSKSMLTDSADEGDEDDMAETSDHPQGSYTLANLYTLRAVITHYGTHGDGHYIAYRQSLESLAERDSRMWWRLSDEDVVQVDEDIVLNQGGVFMLFYERMEGDQAQRPGSTTPSSEVKVDATDEEASLLLQPVGAGYSGELSNMSGELAAAMMVAAAEEKITEPNPTPSHSSSTAAEGVPLDAETAEETSDASEPSRSGQITEPIHVKNILPSAQMRTASEVSKVEGVNNHDMRGIVPAV